MAVADELGERSHRRLEVGEQLRPDRDDGVPRGEAVEFVAARLNVHRVDVDTPSGVKKHVRDPVWQAPRPCWVTLNSNVSPSQS